MHQGSPGAPHGRLKAARCKILIILFLQRHKSTPPCGVPGEPRGKLTGIKVLKVGRLEKAAAARHTYRRAGRAETRAAARAGRRRRSCRAVKLINMIYVIALLRSMMLCRCQAGAPRRRSLPGFRKTCRSPFQHAASDPFRIIFLVLSLHISLTR
ncbi:MAG: hypothetical protein J3K34DRAFT_440473 [Monoraphidium minutum]|nr:MAG: hypothetical protein J3K34DRAFT_440473 [Monoraphidium minutum]